MYRQVTLTALRDLMAGKASAADRKLAYLDVEAAWYNYLKRDNAGRGVVLIGHSQGAGILKQLVAGVIEKDADMRRKMIAAYLIGTNVAVPPGGDVGGDFKRTKLCKSMQPIWLRRDLHDLPRQFAAAREQPLRARSPISPAWSRPAPTPPRSAAARR